jgi:hypothetical protein
MAKMLSRLLGRNDIMFTLTLDDLEKTTGRRGIDVRLVGDILHNAHRVIRRLGLDSGDTTPLELYNALRVNDDDELLKDTPFAGIFFDGECVSFNAQDIKDDEANGSNFKDRSLVHMHAALEKEIARRYKESRPKNDKIVNRILLNINKKGVRKK